MDARAGEVWATGDAGRAAEHAAGVRELSRHVDRALSAEVWRCWIRAGEEGELRPIGAVRHLVSASELVPQEKPGRRWCGQRCRWTRASLTDHEALGREHGNRVRVEVRGHQVGPAVAVQVADRDRYGVPPGCGVAPALEAAV